MASEPQSIAVRYGQPWAAAEVQVSTCANDPFDDLAELVDSTTDLASHVGDPPAI